ncbi:MAG: ATP-dependent DNA helicase [Deinococcales bacterium]
MLAFPFKTYRKGQREAIEAAITAFNAGKRFVIIEAPTGAGKSAIAITLARQSRNAYILTAQKLLQEQYLRDFPDLSLMKGRANYPCLVADTHAAAAPCIAGHKFSQCVDCPYFVQKDIAMAAHSTVMNYAYYLTELNYAGGFADRNLLILDEAHNAEGSLMNFIQISLSDYALMRVGIPERIPQMREEVYYFDFAEDIMQLIRQRGKELDKKLKDEDNKLHPEEAIDLMHHKQWCDNQAHKLKQLIYNRGEFDEEWVVEKSHGREGVNLNFKPVTVAQYAQDYLFREADQVLLLSATILDPPTYLRSLGIDQTEAAVIQMPSDFPPENRPIFLKKTARMTRHYLERDLPKLVKEIEELMTSHAQQKGIIHAHSYKIASYIYEHLAAKHKARLISHFSAGEREAAYEKHSRDPRPTVLLSPSMTEGIDLADDLSRWQVICKIPYPYLGDPQVARRKDIDPAWYDWNTCLTVVQAYGRSVRSRDDFAVTYVLDADFGAFVKRQHQRLPRWFLEAIHD